MNHQSDFLFLGVGSDIAGDVSDLSLTLSVNWPQEFVHIDCDSFLSYNAIAVADDVAQWKRALMVQSHLR